jgi:hypothetical protein
MKPKTSQPPKFFITYSWKDMEFARRLRDDLQESRLEGFFDAYSIRPGDGIAALVTKGLEECDVYVPILSFAALESPWCKEEIDTAIRLSQQPSRRGRPRIIPVLIEDCASAMPRPLQDLLGIKFSAAYLSGLWELLEKGFGIDPASRMRRARMFSGPRIQTGEDENDEVWWGAYEALQFRKQDSGKTLAVQVNSIGNDLSIELWRGAYDGKDLRAWMRSRVEVARSDRGRDPTLTWKIEVGDYTVYFVDYVRLEHSIRHYPHDTYWAYRIFPVSDYEILYRIEVR